MHANVTGQPTKPSLYSKRTDWNYFREILDDQLTLTVPLKTKIDIEEAVINITTAIQNAAWQATPDSNNQTYTEESPIIIHQKIAAKRKARKRWQLTRAPHDKQYNKLAKELKHLLRTHKNESIQNYLQELTPTAATDYSLWRATRKLKHPQHHIQPLRVNSTNGQAKSHGIRQTSRFSLYTVSIKPVAHGRRNHHERIRRPSPDDPTNDENQDTRG